MCYTDNHEPVCIPDICRAPNPNSFRHRGTFPQFPEAFANLGIFVLLPFLVNHVLLISSTF